ncbi:MAG: DUF2095 family protein [Candidatus Kariarchaeaceae archaeon]|jgi:hypothetical protein
MDQNSQENENSVDPEFNGFTLEEIEKHFKSLASELKTGKTKVAELANEGEHSEEASKVPFFRGYQPKVLDFLARATTIEECHEIIDYCLSQREITLEEAEKLRTQLTNNDRKIFGSRKPGYYDAKL